MRHFPLSKPWKCDKSDLGEFIAIVCDRTTEKSIESINKAKVLSESAGIPFKILYQTKPFAGGAVQDGMTEATSSHTLMMAPDLETDPHLVKDFITFAKKYHPIIIKLRSF